MWRECSALPSIVNVSISQNVTLDIRVLTVNAVLTGALNRSIPRTCTPEIVNNDNISKVSGENSVCECMYPTHVADLAINRIPEK